MDQIKYIMRWTLASLFVLVASGRCADEVPPRPQETSAEGHVRAGCPQVVSPYSQPSNTPDYRGYYVGGGAAVHGQARSAIEGTWGWDYVGLFPKRVALNWWHGARPQGGGGAYATDKK